jgi:hypothetical protein
VDGPVGRFSTSFANSAATSTFASFELIGTGPGFGADGFRRRRLPLARTGLLALKAYPIPLNGVCAEVRGHHRHAADGAHRGTVIVHAGRMWP